MVSLILYARAKSIVRLLWSISKRGWQEKSTNFHCPFESFDNYGLFWGGSTFHLDDEPWPRKKQKPKSPSHIEIAVKPSALVILQRPLVSA